MSDSAHPVILDAAIPMPLQIVIDDVGWWSGEDGHERNEPYRTGIARNHAPADYEAIAYLGRELNMRPQAAMILCEWDKENILRALPSCTWMGERWDNAKWLGPRQEEAAHILRTNSDNVELTLHGIGHEYWNDRVMERAEWHDRDGRMRPRDGVLKRFDLFARVLEQHELGPFPTSFVPAAFLHHFRNPEGGLAPLLEEAGIQSLSTPFSSMHRSEEPAYGHFGLDANVMTIDRGHDLCPWHVIGPDPQGRIDGPVCGMHWPNLLHADPKRNHEVVDRWIRLLRSYDDRVDRMLAPDTESFCAQLAWHECLSLVHRGSHLELAATEPGDLPDVPSMVSCVVRVLASSPVTFSVSGRGEVETQSVRSVGSDRSVLSKKRLHPGPASFLHELVLSVAREASTVRLTFS